jgi:hypothetical protein
MIEWFRRLGDIPGITFAKDPAIDPTKLEGYGAVPETDAYDSDGTRHEYLTWRFGGGLGGSASPAHNRAFGDFGGATGSEVLLNCIEGLELPGVPSDYHFMIQSTATQLWKRRREEPAGIAEVERLCWLDLELIDARPDSVTNDNEEGGPSFYSIAGFGILIDLFEREGGLYEALEMAERAERFGQGSQVRDELTERIEAVRSETHG